MDENNAQSELSDQVAALRRQTFILLLALIIVSSTIGVYLVYQSRILSESIEASKIQTSQFIQNYNQNVPVIQSIVKQLVAYGKTHPDFQQQVLKKYGITEKSVPDAPKK